MLHGVGRQILLKGQRAQCWFAISLSFEPRKARPRHFLWIMNFNGATGAGCMSFEWRKVGEGSLLNKARRMFAHRWWWCAAAARVFVSACLREINCYSRHTLLKTSLVKNSRSPAIRFGDRVKYGRPCPSQLPLDRKFHANACRSFQRFQKNNVSISRFLHYAFYFLISLLLLRALYAHIHFIRMHSGKPAGAAVCRHTPT